MSNDFEKEAREILDGSPEPDADATTIKEVADAENPADTKRKRGPYKKRDKNGVAKKSQSSEKFDMADFDGGAKAVNTAVFIAATAFCGTKDAWPDDARAEIMDKALARYMAHKNMAPSPEVMLLAAYMPYFADLTKKETVRENLAKKFGFLKGRLNFISKISSYFTKKEGEK